MDLFSNLALGFAVALSASALWWCAVGVTLGTLIGVLPGIGPLASIGILLPLTFHLPPTEAIIMLAGIYYGSMYGGSTAAILLNLPGTAGAVVACFDGYPMARNGRGGVALFMTTIASFVGSVIGAFLLAAFTPLIAAAALNFGSPEYFALMLFGLLAASMVGEGSVLRSLAMVVLGLLLGIVGTDINTGMYRFTFGFQELSAGISLVAITTGIFGVSEIIMNVGQIRRGGNEIDISWRAILPTRADWRDSFMPMVRGTGIGAVIGALPGSGSALATFIAYGTEKRVARDPSRFGQGAIEGVTAPEAANNAAAQTAFVPTLSLGIPGDAVVAVMLGALILHGITPGPNLIAENASLFWGLTVSFLIGNVLLVILNIPLIGVWVRILQIPYRYLYPAIIIFISVGVYSLQNSVFDVLLVAIFGLLGVALRLLRFHAAPLLLGMVLGPLLEENLRRSMVLSRGDPTIFVHSPISAVFLGLSALLIVWVVVSALRRRFG
jgi:putative tricarboxylic transport membrane protein